MGNNTLEKEAKELVRLRKAASAPKPAYYLGMIMVVLTIIYIVDEVTSNINSAMQPYIIFDLFKISSRDVNSTEYKESLNYVASWNLLSNLFLIIAPFYKALSDRYGRRLFLMINTIGMGLGMLVVMTSTSVVQYIVGMLFMLFFTPNDMQVLYIMETAPKEKRATYSFVAKGIALISVSSIGILSKFFLNEAVPSSWKYVYVIPVAVALVVGILSVVFVKETPVFLEQRIFYLSLTEEEKERRRQTEKENNTSDQGGVFNAFKFIFTNKQLRWILIAGFLFFATTFYTSYYATVLEGAMTTQMVSLALLIYPFCNGIVTILSGLFSDKLGRKRVCLLLGTIALGGLLIFVLACRLGWGPITAGVAYGCSIGGLWSMSDTLILTMPAESSPSSMRSSVMGTISVLIGAGMFIGQIAFIIGQKFIPIDVLFLVICVPFMALSLIILMTKVKETKFVNLDQVTVDTFK
ncbi:Sugar phosphate permease [Butyrivibrio fibrisolvens 16/4]|nr:Sugar phosphate permease [Butyrivibrio fibrisolvens 16/4]